MVRAFFLPGIISLDSCFFSLSFSLGHFAICYFLNGLLLSLFSFLYLWFSFSSSFLATMYPSSFLEIRASLECMLHGDQPMDIFNEEDYDVSSHAVLSRMCGQVAGIQRVDKADYKHKQV